MRDFFYPVSFNYTVIFYFFQILIVSLFLAPHDFIMYKDSNVFKFTNFPFKRNYNDTVVYYVDSNYLFSR